MEERIVEKIMEFSGGRHDEVIAWLVKLGCTVEAYPSGKGWTVIGLTGMTCGLMVMGPLDCVAPFGFIMAGVYWFNVYPNLLAMVDKHIKAGKAKR